MNDVYFAGLRLQLCDERDFAYLFTIASGCTVPFNMSEQTSCGLVDWFVSLSFSLSPSSPASIHRVSFRPNSRPQRVVVIVVAKLSTSEACDVEMILSHTAARKETQ